MQYNLTWYWLKDCDVLRLGWWPQAWRKVMAAYRWGDLKVTCGLTACTPGSAPNPSLGNEYGRLSPLFPYTFASTTLFCQTDPTDNSFSQVLFPDIPCTCTHVSRFSSEWHNLTASWYTSSSFCIQLIYKNADDIVSKLCWLITLHYITLTIF